MAKCIITFEDDDESGKPKLTITFDPPINNPTNGEKMTPAQKVGWSFAQEMTENKQQNI
jgi:hypothetical protein